MVELFIDKSDIHSAKEAGEIAAAKKVNKSPPKKKSTPKVL